MFFALGKLGAMPLESDRLIRACPGWVDTDLLQLADLRLRNHTDPEQVVP